jgi:hypothetical protein
MGEDTEDCIEESGATEKVAFNVKRYVFPVTLLEKPFGF